MLLRIVREALGRLIVLGDHLTRPRPPARSAQAQAAVDAQAAHMALYQFYACPFCIRTRRAMHRLGLPIETRDAQNDPRHRRDLLDGGGKLQVPCLRLERDGETRWLYESTHIIEYLEGRFGAAADADARPAKQHS